MAFFPLSAACLPPTEAPRKRGSATRGEGQAGGIVAERIEGDEEDIVGSEERWGGRNHAATSAGEGERALSWAV
jgi:hypothetical protein